MSKINFRTDILPLKNTLYRLALRITADSDEAEDIVQETMVKVWNNRDNWDAVDSLKAWCCTIARNLSLDSVKSRSRSLEVTGIVPEERPDSADNPFESLMKADRRQRLRAFINTLPEKQRTCLQLRDFEGYSYKEIAQVLAITEEQVKVNIFRARQALKKHYTQKDNENGL